MPRCHVTDRLCFDDLSGCRHDDGGLSFVHACKEPCHRHAAGYQQRSLESQHQHYLSVEKPHHLYLNLIDPPVPLFKLQSFALFFDFVDREIAIRPVLIHCNKGESRAPSLALLYMAKRLRLLPDDSYQTAADAFSACFPYKPGKGIAAYLQEKWNDLGHSGAAAAD